ncbi:MAG: T9SS type A sorting domain-containing protein [Sphingobacteriaceae bacterium]|nr:T9SS type A sorting domain-containing protein [Sphingobacteriaceae bacterium]
MKSIFTKSLQAIAITLSLLTSEVSAQNWTWVKGNNNLNNTGTYGTIGVSSISNFPGSRTNSAKWIDSSGNLWLFGGDGFPATTSTGLLNDLWRYNPTTNQWTWMKGNNNLNSAGSYGTKGVAASGNYPGSRQGAITWTDASGNLWLFGGVGHGATTGSGMLNDLWRYNITTNQWTWMSGNSNTNSSGDYGTIGVSAPTNYPGSRQYSVSWADALGNLWLFGGFGFPEVTATGLLNDLWKYNIATNQWTWMKGNKSVNNAGDYGTVGVAASTNYPGGRNMSCSWTDATGKLWLFGGTGIPETTGTGQLNDFWVYNPTTNNWTWMKGNKTLNNTGTYGTLGVASLSNYPGARSYSGSWTDATGDLWLFGGEGYPATTSFGSLNDLWKYNVVSNQWTWMKGNTNLNSAGVYGTIGVSSPSNYPGSRKGHLTWADASNNLWLFGGFGIPATTSTGHLNDLWKYSIASTASVNESSVSNANFVLYPNPAKNELNVINDFDKYKIELYDVTGKLILSDSNLKKVDLSSINSGLFIVRIISNENEVLIKKLIKE